MRNLLQEKPLGKYPFILHYISSSALMEEVPLQKATKHCTDRPILVIARGDNVVKARCCVPKVGNTHILSLSCKIINFVLLNFSNFKLKISMQKNGCENLLTLLKLKYLHRKVKIRMTFAT